MEIFEEEVRLRASVGEKYTERLKDANVITPYIEPHNTSVYAQYTIRVERRDELRAQLQEAGIPTAVHYPLPLNRQPMFAYLGKANKHLPNAEDIAEHVLSLPMSAWMENRMIDLIVTIINEALCNVLREGYVE